MYIRDYLRLRDLFHTTEDIFHAIHISKGQGVTAAGAYTGVSVDNAVDA